MRGSWRAAALAAVLAAGAAGTAAFAGHGPTEVKVGGFEFNRFLFFAVLEGACEDNPGDRAVDAILETDEKGHYRNFVYACPVCHPVIDALRAFRMRNQYYYAHKGDPLVDDLAASPVAALSGRILGTDPAARGAALHDLVGRWVSRRMDRLRLDEEQRRAWRQAMAIGRKEGMGGLDRSEGFQHKSCPSCDGAAGKDDLWK